MRIIFNPNESRVFSRNKSLSKVPMVIRDDVNPTDDVEIKILDDKISVEPTGKNPEITAETEWLFIGKTVGLFGAEKKLKSILEVIICDDAVAVHLMKGAITVHPDEQKAEDVVLVASGIDESTCPVPYLTTIQWVDRDYFCSLFKYWGDMAKDFPADYLYQIVASGSNKDTSSITLAKLNMADISYGKLAEKEAYRIEKKRKSQLKNVGNLFNTQNNATPQFEIFDSDEDEFDEDEDADMFTY